MQESERRDGGIGKKIKMTAAQRARFFSRQQLHTSNESPLVDVSTCGRLKEKLFQESQRAL